MAHCDFVYAGESAKFQMPFVNLALVPEFGRRDLLPLGFGYTRAAELVLLGKPFDASRAAKLGLVTQVVAELNLLETAAQTARTLAAKPATPPLQKKRDAQTGLLAHTTPTLRVVESPLHFRPA